jgi:hypothetical protein
VIAKTVENLPIVKQAIKSCEKDWTWHYSILELTMAGVDKALFNVTPANEEYAKWWEYTGPRETVPGLIAGGVGEGGSPPFFNGVPTLLDERIIEEVGGTVIVHVNNGKAKLESNFEVQIKDTFDFNPGGYGPIENPSEIDWDWENRDEVVEAFLIAGVVGAFATLEFFGRAFDVPFKTDFFPTNQTVPFGTVPENCEDDDHDDEEESGSPASWDPNDKTSPAGKGEENYIGRGTLLMPYKIRFENKTEATAPAVLVRVIDILDADLDLSTLELTEITFADQVISVPKGLSHYETHRDLIIDNEFVSQEKLRVKVEADLNFETRTLTLVITGVSPQTGWIPADPFLGFLYPNDDTQRGTGSLSYIVRPKAGLADETKITNKAIIFFDWNELIETNEVFNTIGELKQSPLIIVTEPDGINDNANASFTITWTDKAPENDALISIYYDTNNSGEDGTLIVSNLSSEEETNRYTWDTSALPEGDYYIYAVIDDGVHAPVINLSSGVVTIRHEPKLLVELSNFAAMRQNGGVWLTWETQTERDSQGFRIWRITEGNSNGGYTNVTLLKAVSASQAACVEGQLIAATGIGSQNQFITAIGHSTAGACYAFQDTSLFERGIYYYVLEEVDMSGQRTFHCNDMDAVTIGQGPAIDLTAAKRFCRQATGSVE